MGERHRPASFRDLCTPSAGKSGRRPRACLIALLRMPSMVVRCLSSITLWCVAGYLIFRNCSTAIDLRGRFSLRFTRALANFLTSLVVWRKCYRKSSMGLMWTPSILYYLFGGRYLMWVQSTNVIELACF